jgi:hypothetical protein
MTSPIKTNASRLATLTEAWRAFLHDCPLPEPALVSLEPTINRITIQAGGGQDPLASTTNARRSASSIRR